jgi:hypothetical protein
MDQARPDRVAEHAENRSFEIKDENRLGVRLRGGQKTLDLSRQLVRGKRLLQERSRLPVKAGIAGHEENLSIGSVCDAVGEL